MKTIVSFVSIAAACALILAGCSSSGDSDSAGGGSAGTGGIPVTNQAVAAVASYSPTDLEPSGAPAAWTESDIASATDTIVADPLVSTAMSSFTGMYGQSSSARATGMTLEDVIDDVAASIKDLPTTKSADKTYDLSGKALSDYFTAKKMQASVKTKIVTTDGAALDMDEGSNFLSGSGTMTLSADIDAVKTKIPSESSVKDVKVKVNLAAVASLGSYVNAYNERETKDLTFSYATSMSFAASYNDGSVGGKLIITASANKPTTTLDTSVDSDDDDYEMNIIMPSTVSISITAYDDAGTAVVTKNFATFKEFQDYINQ